MIRLAGLRPTPRPCARSDPRFLPTDIKILAAFSRRSHATANAYSI